MVCGAVEVDREASLPTCLVDALVSAADSLVPGDTLDPKTNFGAIASATQLGRVRELVASAHEEGARLLTRERPVQGCFMAPMIFGQVTRDMRIAREEVFGPVMSIHTFQNFERSPRPPLTFTRYGLAASLWTKDLRRAQQAIGALDAGKLIIRSAPGAGEQTGFALASEA